MRLVFHLIPHTHWDREWYLPEAAFRVRLVAMLDDLIGRLEADPALEHFLLDGQVVLLEDYLAVRPDRRTAVASLVTTGRLEIGPWYVLADEQIVSGESLIRNLLVGQRLAEQLGRSSAMLHAPDAFGHPAVLPDLAREFGLEVAVLWRGYRSAAANPRDGFRWSGPAGGQLVVYHLPPAGYEIGAALPADHGTLALEWPRLRAGLVARHSSPHVAVFVGADHHWVNRDLGALRRGVAALEPGNDVRISRADEFLAEFAASARGLPAVTGELRDSYGDTWILQGTHATRAPMKRRNAELEVCLERLAAPLVALAAADDLRASLAFTWAKLLATHFHDAICGTVSDAVALDLESRVAAVEAAGREIVRRAAWRVLGHDPDRARESPERARSRLALWNPAPRPRGGVVLVRLSTFRREVLVGPPGGRTVRTAPGGVVEALALESGEGLPLQVLSRRIAHERLDADHHYPDQDEVDEATVALDAPRIDGFGWRLLEPARAAVPAQGRVTAGGNTLDNGFVRVTLSRRGLLDLVDHRSGVRFAGLLELVGGGDRGDTYTWCPTGPERPLAPATPVRIRRLAEGPLVGALEASWTVKAGSPAAGVVGVRLLVQLFRGSPLVRCVLELDNQAVDHRLRARLPLGLAGAPLIAGAQLGTIRRTDAMPPTPPHVMESRVSTAPAHRFVAAADGARGLAFLAPGFFEVEWSDGDVLVTLLRAVGELSRNDLETRPGHAAWPESTPLAQCPGTSRVAFAVVPVDEASLHAGHVVPAWWDDAFVPLQPFWMRDATDLEPPADFIELEGEGLVLSTIKPAEDSGGIVVRCWNALPRSTRGELRFGTPRTRAWRTRADEREGVPLPLDQGGRVLPLELAPHAWITCLIR